MNSDEFRIQQIIDNIIGNAIKFTYGGKIDVFINYFVVSKQILIQIVDNGCGIPAEKISKLQQLFHTLNM